MIDGDNHVGAPVMGQFDGLEEVFMRGECNEGIQRDSKRGRDKRAQRR